MKILVIGGGAREHALCWTLHKSERVTEVVCAPGNGGIAAVARCVPVDATSLVDMLQVADQERPDLVVVGPEIPLSLGIVDALTARGIRVFGPTKAAARLETSKAFAKAFMQRWKIPTATYAVCESIEQVGRALADFAPRVVVKADGLAAGKGVVLAETHAEALIAAREMFDGALLGSIVASVVIEEMLQGPEISFFAVCDGAKALTLAVAQDHKRIGEGDTGPNTGGMGAYSTDDLLSAEMTAWVLEHVAQRVVDGMKSEGSPFVGVLFVGLMMTPSGAKVLEFNTRFGDPETEAILVRLETDLVEILEAAVDGVISEVEICLRLGAGVSVIAASAGYPGRYSSGKVITGLDKVPRNVEVFHAGTLLIGQELRTSGGRVLAVTAAGENLDEALESVYTALSGIVFEGMQYRRDIGWRARGAKKNS